jgi:hypothetical protein
MTRLLARRNAVFAGALTVLVLGAGSAQAQSTQVLTINARVLSRAELTLSPTTINFPDANPTTTPSIAANTPVAVTARVRTNGQPTLGVVANADLTSGSDTIAVNQVTWTATAPFVAGTMNFGTSQNAASFAIGSGSYSGTYTFALANSWNYAIGAYSTTATYTLTAP